MEGPPPESLAHWATKQDGERLTFSGTGVAVHDKGVLILGPSGSGKSSLALALMAHGAQLISDDGIWLDGGMLIRPETAPPLIEARGIGLLNAGPITQTASLRLVVDLSRAEPHRLPPSRFAVERSEKAQLILGAEHPSLGPAVLHLMLYGKLDPDP